VNEVVIPAASKLNFRISKLGLTKEAVLAILKAVVDVISFITASPKYVAVPPSIMPLELLLEAVQLGELLDQHKWVMFSELVSEVL
jgi:hypothetical protein